MDRELLLRLEHHLVGQCCSIERQECDWALSVAGGGSICLPVPWRIVANGRIAFSDNDDGHQFGLPAPIDGEVEVNRLLTGKAITGLSIDPETADLSVRFEGGVRLDVFNYSCGYEGWRIDLPSGDGAVSVIALGGGVIAYLE